jgi:hypothetical protein
VDIDRSHLKISVSKDYPFGGNVRFYLLDYDFDIFKRALEKNFDITKVILTGALFGSHDDSLPIPP